MSVEVSFAGDHVDAFDGGKGVPRHKFGARFIARFIGF